jgi:dTDP-4-amino-4,6-dideoxygalactose transaminase
MIASADPRANYLSHQAEIDQALRTVLESGRYILGPQVEQFEREFAAYLGVGHAIGVGSGTDALHLALRALEIAPGDAVVTVSNTAVATIAAIELAGAQPVLIDVDPDTGLLDPNRLGDALKSLNGSARNAIGRVKAVIPVHLFGNPVNMPAVMELARQYDLRVVEDCAQAHGAMYAGTKVGGFGHAAAFSFYPTKNLGGLGDGGAIVTNDPAVAQRCTLLRQYGWQERYISQLKGMNSRLDEIQAAVLRVKLRHLDPENARRRRIANTYTQQLAGTNLALPQAPAAAFHVYHQYVVRSSRRDALRRRLEVGGIATQILYPVPIHIQPAYLGQIPILGGELTVTENLAKQILSLPIHPQLDDSEVARVAGMAAELADA